MSQFIWMTLGIAIATVKLIFFYEKKIIRAKRKWFSSSEFKIFATGHLKFSHMTNKKFYHLFWHESLMSIHSITHELILFVPNVVFLTWFYICFLFKRKKIISSVCLSQIQSEVWQIKYCNDKNIAKIDRIQDAMEYMYAFVLFVIFVLNVLRKTFISCAGCFFLCSFVLFSPLSLPRRKKNEIKWNKESWSAARARKHSLTKSIVTLTS